MEQLCIHLCYTDETRCKISNLCTCCISSSLCFAGQCRLLDGNIPDMEKILHAMNLFSIITFPPRAELFSCVCLSPKLQKISDDSQTGLIGGVGKLFFFSSSCAVIRRMRRNKTNCCSSKNNTLNLIFRHLGVWERKQWSVSSPLERFTVFGTKKKNHKEPSHLPSGCRLIFIFQRVYAYKYSWSTLKSNEWLYKAVSGETNKPPSLRCSCADEGKGV